MGCFPAAVRDGGRAQLHLPVAAGAVVDPTDGEIIRASARRGLSPELRLRLTVLLHALMELRRFHPQSPDGAAVRAWFASAAGEWPYSLVGLCEALGVEPDAVRARARALDAARHWPSSPPPPCAAVRARASACASQMHQSTES